MRASRLALEALARAGRGHTHRKPRTRRNNEAGQTLPLIVMFMFVILGFCAVAIDVGGWYQAKRQAQAAADASALAAAQGIANGQWSSIGTANFALNQKPGETVTLAQSTDLVSNDSITATVSYDAPTYFAKLLGIQSVHVVAVARATVESVHSSTQPIPFAVASSCVTVGQTAAIYGGMCGTSSSNSGAFQLPAAGQTAGDCGSYTTVGSGESQLDSSMLGTTQVGTVNVGGCLTKSKTGNGGQPGNNLSLRPWSQETWPITVSVPVISAPWGNGTNANATVVGFAYFAISGCSGGTGPTSCAGPGGKEIDGTWTGLDSSGSLSGNTGAYVTGYGNAVALTE
jgi:Flp pilus assembly protein TadG